MSQLLNGCQPRLWFVARRGHKNTNTAAASTLGPTVHGSKVGRASGPPLPSLSAYLALETSVSGSQENRELLVLLIIQITMLYFSKAIVYLLKPTMNGISEVFHKGKTGLIVFDNGRPPLIQCANELFPYKMQKRVLFAN